MPNSSAAVFFPTPGHAGNVVHAIAGQRQKIGDEFRRDPEARADVMVVITAIAAVIPEHIAVANQL